MTIDFGAARKFSNGVVVLNCTPHPLTFLDGESVVEVAPCGARLMAAAQEEPADEFRGATLVRTVFRPTEEGRQELAELQRRYHAGSYLLLLGSMLSAQAYPGQIASVVPAPGFERVPPDQKRMRVDKFTIF